MITEEIGLKSSKSGFSLEWGGLQKLTNFHSPKTWRLRERTDKFLNRIYRAFQKTKVATLGFFEVSGKPLWSVFAFFDFPGKPIWSGPDLWENPYDLTPNFGDFADLPRRLGHLLLFNEDFTTVAVVSTTVFSSKLRAYSSDYRGNRPKILKIGFSLETGRSPKIDRFSISRNLEAP